MVSVLKNKRANSRVSFMYPTHGVSNVLRNVKGTFEKRGKGPNGPNVTIREDSGLTKCFSVKKIVEM